jgi:hypothetical protein
VVIDEASTLVLVEVQVYLPIAALEQLESFFEYVKPDQEEDDERDGEYESCVWCQLGDFLVDQFGDVRATVTPVVLDVVDMICVVRALHGDQTARERTEREQRGCFDVFVNKTPCVQVRSWVFVVGSIGAYTERALCLLVRGGLALVCARPYHGSWVSLSHSEHRGPRLIHALAPGPGQRVVRRKSFLLQRPLSLFLAGGAPRVYFYTTQIDTTPWLTTDLHSWH